MSLATKAHLLKICLNVVSMWPYCWALRTPDTFGCWVGLGIAMNQEDYLFKF